MNGDERITGISKFGRLRKISIKLRDLPSRPPSNAQKTSKRKMSSHLNRKDSTGKVTPRIFIDPFVDFEPRKFIALLSPDNSTDTSSSVGEIDERGVTNDLPSGVKMKQLNDNQQVHKSDKVRNVTTLPRFLLSDDTTDSSSSIGGDEENRKTSELLNRVKAKKRTVNRRKHPKRTTKKGQFTAYSLWAQEARLTLLTKHPNRNTSVVSRQLRGMWKKLSTSVKTTFKRKAALPNSNNQLNSTPDCGEVSPPIEIIWVASKY